MRTRSRSETAPGSSRYGPGGGYEPLREWVAARHGVEPGRVVLTVGGLQGFVFYAAEQLARRPGRVLVEAPSYDRPLKILAREGAEIVALEMDDEGLDPDALEAELRRRDDPPSFLYTIPTFQNPSGRTLSAERRARLDRDRPRARAGRPRGRPVRPRALRRNIASRASSSSKAGSSSPTRRRSRRRSRRACEPATSCSRLRDAASFEERAVSTYIAPPFLPQAVVCRVRRTRSLRAESRARLR